MKKIILSYIFCCLTISVFSQHWYAQENQFLYPQKWFGKELPQHIAGFRTAITQRWHPVNNVWVNTTRYANQYVGTNTVPQATVIDIWNESTNVWKSSFITNYNFTNNVFQNSVVQTANAAGVYTSASKRQYNWGPNNQLKEVISQGWDKTNSVWINSFKDTNVYQNNKILFVYKLLWYDSPLFTFYQDARDSLIYDTKDRAIVNYQQALIVGRYLTAQRDIYTLDDATGNRKELRREFIHDVSINTYDTIFRWSYTYNAQNNLTVLMRQQWNATAKLWQNHTRVTNSYNANGKIAQELVEIPNGTGWQNVSRTLYDELTDTDEVIDSDGISIYPNPTSGSSQLELNDKELVVTRVQLFNSIGQLITTWRVSPNNSSISLDSKDLKNGVYIVKVETTKGLIVKKWMKF